MEGVAGREWVVSVKDKPEGGAQCETPRPPTTYRRTNGGYTLSDKPHYSPTTDLAGFKSCIRIYAAPHIEKE